MSTDESSSLLNKRVVVNVRSTGHLGKRGVVTRESGYNIVVRLDHTGKTEFLARVEVMREELYDDMYGKLDSDPIRRAIDKAAHDLETDAFIFREAVPKTLSSEAREKLVVDTMRVGNCDRQTAESAIKCSHEARILLSSRYQVTIMDDAPNGFDTPIIHLSIKRIDRNPIHDWRDLQRIKNAIVGEENEAFELYPAESRLVDTANQYHLWAFTDKRVRIPCGFTSRLVSEEQIGSAQQRPFNSRYEAWPSKAQMEQSLRALVEWMREHTGPSDGTLSILTSAVALLDQIDRVEARAS